MEKQKDMNWVLVDLDGTLVDLCVNWKDVRRSLSDYFSGHGINVNLKPLVPGIENGLRRLKNSKKHRTNVYRILTKGEKNGLDISQKMSWARMLIRSLAKKGYKIAIVSGNDEKVVRKALLKHKMKVDLVIGRSLSNGMKPTKTYLNALVLIVPRERIAAVIGDGWADERVGKYLGKPVFLVRNNAMAKSAVRKL